MFLRYQDKRGRGPFAPGLTAVWADGSGESPPTIFEDFPNCLEVVQRAQEMGLHCGCACRGADGLRGYFTDSERAKLGNLGFHVYRIPNNSVLLESESQVLFAVKKPLRFLPKFKGDV